MNIDEKTAKKMVKRLAKLERQADLIKTVLMIKHPDAHDAAQALHGLRRSIIAGQTERRARMVLMSQVAAAIARATSVDDLRPQLREWIQQQGLEELAQPPVGHPATDLFDDLDGAGLDGEIVVEEPAYRDGETKLLIKRGRARKAAAPDSGTESMGVQA